MEYSVAVSGVSKSFRRYRPDRPHSIQEVLARGLTGLRPTERFWALRDVTFSLAPGRAIGIIGANGSGKSTLLRLIGGIGTVDSGQIRVAGRIGALLDLASGFHGDLSGRENVIVAGVLSGLTRQEVMRRLDAIIAFSEIEPFIDNPMRTYSSGMRMRLAFSTNVHTEPDVLLIDEVLAVGDARFQTRCIERIQRFKRDGCSILMVSHGSGVMYKLCDEALWMHSGRVMAHASVTEAVQRYEAHLGVSMETGRPLDSVTRSAADLGTQIAPDTSNSASPASLPPTRVTRVDVLDGNAHPLVEYGPGQAIRIVFDVESTDDLTQLLVRVKLVRDDGLLCCEFYASAKELGHPTATRRGRISLVVDRLDLRPGHYSVDVSTRSLRSPHYDLGQRGHAFVVEGTHDGDAVLVVPHRWELVVVKDPNGASKPPAG